MYSVYPFFVQAQDYPLLTDHPGTFKLIDWGVYTHWNFGFTKAEYWNKKLPPSAIQVLTFNRLTDTRRYASEKAEALKLNANGYNLLRFLEALDVNMFTGLIDK